MLASHITAHRLQSLISELAAQLATDGGVTLSTISKISVSGRTLTISTTDGREHSAPLPDGISREELTTELEGVMGREDYERDRNGIITALALKADAAWVRQVIANLPQQSETQGPVDSILSLSTEGSDLVLTLTSGKVHKVTLPQPEVDGEFVTLDQLSIFTEQLEGVATKAYVDEQVDSARASVFEPGRRYYSPVTYYWPDYYKNENSEWGKVLRFGNNLGAVILNRNSGNWTDYDADFHKQGRLAKAAGAKQVVFYVKTQYGAAGNPAAWGVGVPDAEKYTHEHILEQLEQVQTHYPDIADGVFLDEFINGWGEHEQRLEWYTELVSKIRARFGKHFLVVGNPGSNISPGVLALPVDVFMTFESTASAYLAEDPASPLHPEHMAAEPGTRFWHVIHDVTTENYRAVFDKADELGIGHLYVTDGQLVMGEGGQWQPEVNPYAVAPTSWIADLLSFWLKGVLNLHEGVEAMRSNALGDTGWVDITYIVPPMTETEDGNFQGVFVTSLKARRIGKIVFLSILGATSTGLGPGQLLGNLPPEFQGEHSVTTEVPMFSVFTDKVSHLGVEGAMLSMSAASADDPYTVSVSYPATDTPFIPERG